jgi:hypothetical protein
MWSSIASALLSVNIAQGLLDSQDNTLPRGLATGRGASNLVRNSSGRVVPVATKRCKTEIHHLHLILLWSYRYPLAKLCSFTADRVLLNMPLFISWLLIWGGVRRLRGRVWDKKKSC